MFERFLLYGCATAGLWLAMACRAIAADDVRFNRDVLPILSDNCFACHGPDAKQAKGGLRLDLRESATKPAKSGEVAVVPGKPLVSALVKRIETKVGSELMPPPDSHKKLSSAQKDVLKRWVAAGAKYEAHWAFVPPVQHSSMAAVGAKSAIDQFILARLAQEKLKPSPEAAKPTLIRRVSYDLTGLPPTTAELDAFLADRSPDAFEKAVVRLLESPHFGERMAMWWLDAARYADTDGFQADATRSNWPWRDWVISAFNANMKFDQFTREQFAGDLLPNATPEQKLATNGVQ